MKKQNLFLWGAMFLALILTTLVVEVQPLANMFEFTSIGWVEYGIAIGLAFLIIPIVEIVKLFQRLFSKNK